MEIRLTRLVQDAIRFAAIETYPNECIGALLGVYEPGLWSIGAAQAYQVADRTPNRVDAPSKANPLATSKLAADFFDDSLLGSFHSHPSALPTLSKGEPHCDFEEMEIDNVEIVASIWPGSRRWNIRLRGYVKLSDTLHRRVRIVCAG